jgi:hypothetical protein
VSNIEFYGQVHESDGVYVILIPSSLANVAREVKDKQIKVSVEF